ncbi:MAG: DUF4831 family protein [Dysgonamonadaceae bacterium]|jgi:hypothetical protein|nr:DUF4831 family protein [Dysgonamonadaceae bacterium]
MKKFFIIFLILPFFGSSRVDAQTAVVKMSATKATDYGVTYYLPKTVFVIGISYSQTTQKAGPLAKYAGKYLGLDENAVVQEDMTFYTLNNVSITSKGIANKDESYLVLFKQKTTAPFVYLRNDGVICTINAEYEAETPVNQPVSEAKSPTVPIANVQSVFTEEYYQAGSTAKMAEVAAKQIYKIRESRNDFLTGEAENMPSDGEGLKVILANLDAQEKTLTELFTGSSTSSKHSQVIEIEPVGDMDKEILFRFSKYYGVTDSDDLSGKPVYINIHRIEAAPEEIVDPKKKEKEEKSIVYNLPGEANVEVIYDNNSLYKSKLQIVQFGTKKILATSIFEDKKAPVKVYFYPETGAVRQITQ